MINESNVKDRDFEYDLKRITGQIHFLAMSLTAVDNADSLTTDDVMGAGYFLNDISEDLETIGNALYPNPKEGQEASHEQGTETTEGKD